MTERMWILFRRDQYEVKGCTRLALIWVMLCHKGFEASGRGAYVYVRRSAIIGSWVIAFKMKSPLPVRIYCCPVTIIIMSIRAGQPEFDLRIANRRAVLR